MFIANISGFGAGLATPMSTFGCAAQSKVVAKSPIDAQLIARQGTTDDAITR
jgi:hypothetical protein